MCPGIPLFVCWILAAVVSADVADLDRLLNDVLNGYNKQYLPNVNDSTGDALDVDVTVYVISINAFDEISGEIQMTVSFDFQWKEERIQWVDSDYGNIRKVLLPTATVWTPDIYLFNAADRMVKAGQNDVLVRIDKNGFATWGSAQVIRFTCGVSVKYYPFDSQTCYLDFISWSYDYSDVKLRDAGERLKLKYFTNNSVWEFLGSSLRPGVFESKSYLRYEITLKRKPSYFLVYIISPVIILGLLNTLVFVIPYSSGERLSVAMTCVLSYVVFMEIISSNVPGNSDPVAATFFYLLFLMVHSSTAMILLVLSHRIHDKSGPVYKPWQSLTNFLRFKPCLGGCNKSCFQKFRHRVSTTKDDVTENPDENSANEKTALKIDDCDNISWTDVGDTLDWYFFGFTFISYLCASLGFLIAIYANTF